MILLMLFLFLLSFQSAWSAEDEAEILIFSLSPEKVEEQQGSSQNSDQHLQSNSASDG